MAAADVLSVQLPLGTVFRYFSGRCKGIRCALVQTAVDISASAGVRAAGRGLAGCSGGEGAASCLHATADLGVPTCRSVLRLPDISLDIY